MFFNLLHSAMSHLYQEEYAGLIILNQFITEQGKSGKVSDVVADVLQVLPCNQASTCLFTDTWDKTFSYVSSFPLCAFSIMEFLYGTPMLCTEMLLHTILHISLSEK